MMIKQLSSIMLINYAKEDYCHRYGNWVGCVHTTHVQVHTHTETEPADKLCSESDGDLMGSLGNYREVNSHVRCDK